ncbi:MAG: hypothetical protein AUG51_20325 [Acidobacteria bacterium 13_1_20CM_3_53_8]|nr:MAG: hypothetical protein AUG51_20325 [Acidobacteria bacterium 13_1_20CM_3_53_8]
MKEGTRRRGDAGEEGKRQKVKGKSEGKPIFLLNPVSSFLLPFTFCLFTFFFRRVPASPRLFSSDNLRLLPRF